MPRPRKYSVEEVLNLTVKDIQGPNFVDVKIKGWLELTSEQQEQCMAKLRDLVRQRDEIPQSKAVDASELVDRLNRIERSRSRSWCTPIASPYNPNDPKEIEKDLKVEREAHEELVRDNGQPCYPIELGFDIFKHPGQYKEIFEYWQDYESGASEAQNDGYSSASSNVGRNFANSSSDIDATLYTITDGDMQLLEEQDKQSKLDDWMEYQDYELGIHEHLQKEFKDDQELLACRRKALAEAGISAFEGVQELEFASYYSLILECGGEEGEAEKKVKLAERKLRLAETRLKVAESDDLGESVERATWVRLFRKEIKSAQMRMDELQRLAEDAERELEPENSWFHRRQIEWGKKESEDPEEGARTIRLECDSAEFQDRMKKRKELSKKSHEAGMARFMAEKEVEFTEEVYDAARLDNLGETVKRSALIQMAQREVKSAQTQIEEAKEPLKKIKLKGKVISALSSIPLTRRKVKRHEVLLEWIERQRQEIAGGRADLKKEGGQSQSKVSSRVLRNHPATEASGLNKSPKVNVRQRKQSTARSVLSPVDSTKVSKVYSKKRSSRRRLNVLYDPPQAAAQMTIDSTAPKPRSKRVSKG
ncbi:MAG: hypothetical protein Q9223_004777 [Gallowayella weberi]